MFCRKRDAQPGNHWHDGRAWVWWNGKPKRCKIKICFGDPKPPTRCTSSADFVLTANNIARVCVFRRAARTFACANTCHCKETVSQKTNAWCFESDNLGGVGSLLNQILGRHQISCIKQHFNDLFYQSDQVQFKLPLIYIESKCNLPFVYLFIFSLFVLSTRKVLIVFHRIFTIFLFSSMDKWIFKKLHQECRFRGEIYEKQSQDLIILGLVIVVLVSTDTVTVSYVCLPKGWSDLMWFWVSSSYIARVADAWSRSLIRPATLEFSGREVPKFWSKLNHVPATNCIHRLDGTEELQAGEGNLSHASPVLPQCIRKDNKCKWKLLVTSRITATGTLPWSMGILIKERWICWVQFKLQFHGRTHQWWGERDASQQDR